MTGRSASDTETDRAGRAREADAAGLRTIDHGGTPNPARFHWVRSGVRQVETVLPAGRTVAEAIAELLARENCAGGIIELSGGRLDPFTFVIPADDPHGKHAVWYSRTHECVGGATFDKASCSVGLSAGQPFLHCHGLWRGADGAHLGGHLLPSDTRIVEPVEVRAVFATDANFDRRPDAETGFELFSVAGGGPGDGVLATVRPNIDIVEAIEGIARASGIGEATIHGIGSLIDMATADGAVATSLALEVAITGGRIVSGDSGPEVVDLAMAGVGMDGVPAEGRLLRGRNRVCVTFELLLASARP